MFYHSSIVILFEKSSENLLGYFYLKFVYQRVTPPYVSLVYTISGSSKTCSVNSLLEHTGKHH